MYFIKKLMLGRIYLIIIFLVSSGNTSDDLKIKEKTSIYKID